jgi:hypothetical protein
MHKHYRVTGIEDVLGNLIAELVASQENVVKQYLRKCIFCQQEYPESQIRSYPQWGPNDQRVDVDICDHCVEYYWQNGKWRDR